VIASNVGGHRELIRHGETGLLFEAGNVDDLADKILELLTDPQRCSALCDAGRRFVEKERTWTASVDQYVPVYTRLLSNVS